MSNLELRTYRGTENGVATKFNAFTFSPKGFSTEAIKDILTNMVYGRTERSIVFIPEGGNPECPEEILYEELIALKTCEEAERLATLEREATRLKGSSTIAIIEKI